MAEGGSQSQQLGRMNSHPQVPLQQLNQPPLSSRPTSPPSSISPPRVSGQMTVAPHVGGGIGAQTQQQQAPGAMRRDPHSRKASACDRDHPSMSTAGRVEGTRKVRGVYSVCRGPIAGTVVLLLVLVSAIKGRMVFIFFFFLILLSTKTEDSLLAVVNRACRYSFVRSWVVFSYLNLYSFVVCSRLCDVRLDVF